MSKAALLIVELRSRGVELSVTDSGGIKFVGPRGTMNPELQGAVKIHRDALVDLLQLEAGLRSMLHRMEVLMSAAAANERYGAQSAADEQYRQAGDILEASFPVEEKLRALAGEVFAEYWSSGTAATQPELVGVR